VTIAARTPASALPPVLVDRRVLLGAIVLLAIICRATGAGDRLSHDEGYSWFVASAPDAGSFLDRLATYENTPPLFYLLLAPLTLDDEVWIRLPSIVAGVAAVPVLYAVVRPLLGTRAALLAALGLTVAPLAVAYSNFARAYVLANLGMLLALWAAARLAQGARRRWWWLYAAGAIIALYSEYYAPLFLISLIGALLAIRARPPREVLALGLAPFLTLLPWLPELRHALDLEGETKRAPESTIPTPELVRDEILPLFSGLHGLDAPAALRTLALLALLALLAGAGWLLLSRGGDREKVRTASWLLAGTAAGTLLLHIAAGTLGPGLLDVRYLTVLIALSAALLAAGVDLVPLRAAVPLVATVLVAVGIALAALREGRELEPDYERAEVLVRESGVRTILTNSAVVCYYLRDLDPTLDFALEIGRGLEPVTSPPYAVVDVGDKARRGPGQSWRFEPERGPVGPQRLGAVTVRIVR
jgi:hypothetical protein